MQDKKHKKEYDKQYHKDNKERLNEYNKQYHKDNREELLLKRKKDYANNKKKYSKRAKKYRTNNAEEIKKVKKQYTATHKKEIRNLNLKYAYGITIDQYEQMFNVQEGKCKICNKHQNELKQPLSVDHNHTTNKIRGLLCQNCNTILGHAKDNIDILQKAINYLKNN